MIGRLLVSPQEMQSAATAVGDYVNTMEDCFSQMKTIINQSSSYWEGKASEAHRTYYEKNIDKIEEMINRYREHVRDLNEMAGVYIEAEITAKNAADELPGSTL